MILKRAFNSVDYKEITEDLIYSMAEGNYGELFLATSDGVYHFQNGVISEISIPNAKDPLSKKFFATFRLRSGSEAVSCRVCDSA